MLKQFSLLCLGLFAAALFVGCTGGGGSDPIPPSNPSAPPASGIDADEDGEEDSPLLPAVDTAS
ncbi:MAG: hypothetical protein ABJZ55_25610 [Fuerstiella sp.]